MTSLHRDPHFTFRFADDRIISRFHLEGVEPGRYELRLRLGEEAIALPPIDVGERPG